jgi:ribokinase
VDRKIITVLGSAMVDLVATTPSHPLIGETVQGSDFAMIPGGKGANQVVTMAKLGTPTFFVGRIGNDLFAELILESMKKSKVDIQFLRKDPSLSTGVAHIRVDQKAQNNIVMIPLANDNVSRTDVDSADEIIKQSAILQLQLEIPLDTIKYAMEKAKRYGTVVVLNPAPAKVLPMEIYPLIDIITPNETEAKSLTGIEIVDLSSARTAAEILFKRGVKKVVITLGAKGCFYFDGVSSIYQPIPLVTAVDTTAAGDAFNGALAVSLIKGKPIEEALRYASAVASLSVTRFGAQSSLPDYLEVEHFLKKVEWVEGWS